MSKTLELLKEHPETTKLIQAWYMDKMLESFKDESVPSDFKEMMRATPIDDDKISKMIDGAPRLLFDFFDENEIIIETVHNGGKWWYSINGASTPNFFSSRKEAEYASIEEAFQLLNDKIVNSDL
jgi:hypothetical protein